MRTRAVLAMVMLAALGIATITLAQSKIATSAPNGAARLSELTKLRAEVELLQLENDVDKVSVKKLMADVSQFDDAAALRGAMIEAAKSKAAEIRRTAKPGEKEPQFVIYPESLDLKFESLGGLELDEAGVKLMRPVLASKKKELIRKVTELNEKRLQLAELEKRYHAAE